ncbi:MAG TPA: hypothetical protein VK911_16565 [Vicinamibacterales bacterium]|nr:hypothetical protein [Vicinamibacterales bacterium]
MRGVPFRKTAVVAAALGLVCLAAPRMVEAQASVAAADIEQLQNDIDAAAVDLSRLRSRDAALAGRLQDDLDGLREEVIYLKVKLRREGRVSRTEHAEVRDRIQDLRSRARGESLGQTVDRSAAPRTGIPAPTGSTTQPRPVEPIDPPQATTTRANTVPVGAELDVRLQRSLSSATAQVEDRFEATTMVDLMQGSRVLIPAGSLVRGVVAGVDRAGRLERTGRLSLSFDQVTVNGRSYPIQATVVQALESEGIRGEAGRIGAGAGVGAIIGGILGGFKGALAGILIGGGGTIAATEGKDVELPAGTVLRLRFDSPVTIR